MKEIIKSTVLGFCFGVRRAVELAEIALTENKEKKVYSLGPLIHNEQCLNELKKKGLIIIDEADIHSIPDESVVIIRAHGVSLNVVKILLKKRCNIIDATCTRVKASQKIVEKESLNKVILFTGDSNHGEVKGIASYAENGNFNLIQSLDDLKRLDKKIVESNNILLLSQTTFSSEEFEKIKNYLLKKNPKANVINTICSATKERQNALLNLCKVVDGIIIIGGRNSANTNRLYQIAFNNCKRAVHIETASEIPCEFFCMNKVGITAGASTPDEIISEVEKELLK